jgi:hypothetical protein
LRHYSEYEEEDLVAALADDKVIQRVVAHVEGHHWPIHSDDPTVGVTDDGRIKRFALFTTRRMGARTDV